MSIPLQPPPKGKKKNILGLSIQTPSSPAPTASPMKSGTPLTLSGKGATPDTDLTPVMRQLNMKDGELEDEGADNRQTFEAFVSEAKEKHKFRPADTELRPEDLEVVCELGKGISGVVEKVVHRPTTMIMARKLIHLELKPTIRKQICTELRVLYECKSPYVVGFYGSFFADSDLSIFMEYMDAGSLETLYKLAGAVPEDVLCVITQRILQGLNDLQKNHKILHRDIKPSNILINTKGEVKLCDFGVSGELVNSLANTFVGTRSYMAPERLCGGQYSIQSDVWSLGLTVMEMAVGRFPIPPEGTKGARNAGGLAIFELLEYIVNGPPPQLPDTFSAPCRDFIAQCLIKDARKRPNIVQLLEHPWMKQAGQLKVDLAAWVLKVMDAQNGKS